MWMFEVSVRKLGSIAALMSAGLWCVGASAQQSAAPQDQAPANAYTFKVNSDLVLTNVVARDKKTGAVVTGLTANDFTILENGKPQHIVSFDFESIDQATPLNEATISGRSGPLVLGKNNVATPEQLRDHRLIVFFFDLVSMQPEDLDWS